MNHPSKPLSAMLTLMRQNLGAFIGAMLSTIAIVLIGFATPLLMAETIDCVLGTQPSSLPEFILAPIRALGGRDFLRRSLWAVGLALVGLNLVNGVFTYLKGRLTAVASENIAMTLRENLYEHLQRLPFAYHVKAETGDLIQRCTSDVETIRRFLSVQVMEVVNTVLMVTIALVILLGRSVPITLLSMVLVPALFYFAMWFFEKVHKHFKIADESEGRMSAVLQENLSGVRGSAGLRAAGARGGKVRGGQRRLPQAGEAPERPAGHLLERRRRHEHAAVPHYAAGVHCVRHSRGHHRGNADCVHQLCGHAAVAHPPAGPHPFRRGQEHGGHGAYSADST